MSLKIIVAVAKNGAIGKDNHMPWDLPEDLKYFKETTMGHAIIMGRKTYESLGKALPGRKNIVISRSDIELSDAIVYNSLTDAIESENDAFIIGGAEIYKQAMPFADYLYITHIDAEIEADRYFPPIDESLWEKQSSKQLISANGIPLEFAIYGRNLQSSKIK